jgi:hypothetical protein
VYHRVPAVPSSMRCREHNTPRALRRAPAPHVGSPRTNRQGETTVPPTLNHDRRPRSRQDAKYSTQHANTANAQHGTVPGVDAQMRIVASSGARRSTQQSTPSSRVYDAQSPESSGLHRTDETGWNASCDRTCDVRSGTCACIPRTCMCAHGAVHGGCAHGIDQTGDTESMCDSHPSAPTHEPVVRCMQCAACCMQFARCTLHSVYVARGGAPPSHSHPSAPSRHCHRTPAAWSATGGPPIAGTTGQARMSASARCCRWVLAQGGRHQGRRPRRRRPAPLLVHHTITTYHMFRRPYLRDRDVRRGQPLHVADGRVLRRHGPVGERRPWECGRARIRTAVRGTAARLPLAQLHYKRRGISQHVQLRSLGVLQRQTNPPVGVDAEVAVRHCLRHAQDNKVSERGYR